MSGLLRAELMRLRSRRLVWAILGLVLVITGLTLYSTYKTSEQYTPAAIAQQKANLQTAHDDWVKNHVQQEKDCRSSYTAVPGQPPVDEMCANPDPANQTNSYNGDGSVTDGDGQVSPSFDTLFREGVEQARTFILFFAMVIGAGLVTAEFSSGAIVNWLSFEPRRTRVFFSKVLSGAVGGALAGVVGAVPLALGTWVVSETVHLGGPSGQALAVIGRLILTGIAGGLIGAALGFILRNTAAVVGFVVAFAIGVEAILAHSIATLNSGMLTLNVTAFVVGRSTWYSDKCSKSGDGELSCVSIDHHLYLWHGAAVTAIYVVVLTAIAWLLFRRRDVT